MKNFIHFVQQRQVTKINWGMESKLDENLYNVKMEPLNPPPLSLLMNFQPWSVGPIATRKYSIRIKEKLTPTHTK